jgi:hypothetical protein
LINIDSWVKFYNFWPKNDVEKWSRRNVYEIATCRSHFLLIHILNRREADYPSQYYRLVSTTFGDGPPWLHVCCACVYSNLPNNNAAHLLIFQNFPHHHALICRTCNTWLLDFMIFPTYTVIWTLHLFGSLE